MSDLRVLAYSATLLAVGTAFGVVCDKFISQRPQQAVYQSPGDSYHLYNSVVRVVAGMATGGIVGDTRTKMVSDLFGDAPFIMNVQLSGVCIAAFGGAGKKFWEAGGLIQDVSIQGAPPCGAAVNFESDPDHKRSAYIIGERERKTEVGR